MKKFFTLFVALVATLAVFAGEITLTPADFTTTGSSASEINQTAKGVTLKYYGRVTQSDIRVNAMQADNKTDNELAISYTSTINKIEIVGQYKKSNGTDAYAITATPGTISVVAGTKDGDFYPITVTVDAINAKSLTIGVKKQLQISEIKLTVDGEVTGGDQGGNQGGNEGGEEEEDWTYDWEDTMASTFNETMTYAEGYIYAVEEGDVAGDVIVYLENQNTWSGLYFNTDLTSSVDPYLPAGTYPINDSGKPNTVYSSRGATEEYDDPSYFAIEDELDPAYYYGYYITSGNVTVSKAADGYTIAVSAKSYYGSTINYTYTGTIEWISETAVENITTDTVNNVRKVFQNGNIYILRDGVKYNVLGTQVK